MKLIKLSNRLKALSNFVDCNASVADIGTDHGYLPIYLAQSKTAKRIIASDISAASLRAARRFAEKYKVTDKIEFIAAPGLDGVKPSDVDIVIIAGMGGETILGILKNAPWTKNKKLILQPQSKIDLICRFLYDNAYNIEESISVNDKGKNYTIILCKGMKH